jgi:hypothetical protein
MRGSFGQRTPKHTEKSRPNKDQNRKRRQGRERKNLDFTGFYSNVEQLALAF